jgi:hypothetical protein
MAGFRRDKPIDPMHERGICLWLAEHHDRRVAETDGWERDDHAKAATACRERAEEWLQQANAAAAPARPVEAVPCKPNPVASHAAPNPQHKPKPKPAQHQPPTVAGQGALF